MKKILIHLLAIPLFLIVVYFGMRMYMNYRISYTLVPIASHNINQRTKLSQDDIEYISIPKDSINEHMIIDESELLDQIVKLTYSIPKGSYFYKNSIESEVKDVSNTLLNKYEFNYDLDTSDIDINTAHLNKNMYIDLYLTIEKNGKVYSDLLLSNCRITGFYDSFGEEINNYYDDSRVSIVSIAILQEDIVILNKALVLGNINCVTSYNTYEDLGSASLNKDSLIYDFLV